MHWQQQQQLLLPAATRRSNLPFVPLVGCSQHTLASNITLLAAAEVDEIFRGNDILYKAAYRGAGADIPGGATLNFDVEVVDITEGPPEPNIFKDLDGDVDGKLSKEEVLAFFKKQGRDELPEGLWEKEDKNEDGVISWEEFSGPKGKTAPPLKDEV